MPHVDPGSVVEPFPSSDRSESHDRDKAGHIIIVVRSRRPGDLCRCLEHIAAD